MALLFQDGLLDDRSHVIWQQVVVHALVQNQICNVVQARCFHIKQNGALGQQVPQFKQ